MQAYKQVAEYQVAETTTAATYETAELYRDLAPRSADFRATEKTQSADELEQYDALLEEQAFPFEEQAISIHELNTKRAPDGVYDESVRKSFDALAKMKPARYGKVERSEVWVADLAVPGQPAPGIAVQLEYEQLTALANGGDSGQVEAALLQFEAQHPGYSAPAIDLGIATAPTGKLADSEAALRRASHARTRQCHGLERTWRDVAPGGQIRRR